MVLTKRLLVGLLIVLAFSATAYAGLSSTLNLMVVPAGSTGVAGPNGQPNPGGLPYNLTTLSGTFTVSVGKSQQITGVGL